MLEKYTIINCKLHEQKTMMEKSSLKPAIKGENAVDWKHFYGKGEVKFTSGVGIGTNSIKVKQAA